MLGPLREELPVESGDGLDQGPQSLPLRREVRRPVVVLEHVGHGGAEDPLAASLGLCLLVPLESRPATQSLSRRTTSA